MAKSKRITPVFSQDRPIQRVALSARVFTLQEQQDPEMQLSELREYAAVPRSLESIRVVDDDSGNCLYRRFQAFLEACF